MTNLNALNQDFQRAPLSSRIITGGLIAFVLITLFFFGDGGPFEFGFRVYFPTITTTIGGMAGGAFYWLMEPMINRSKYKWLLVLLCIIGFVAAIFFSSVIGFAATGDWD